MAYDTHIYGEVKNKSDLKKIFLGIRHDLETAHSRPALTELGLFLNRKEPNSTAQHRHQ